MDDRSVSGPRLWSVDLECWILFWSNNPALTILNFSGWPQHRRQSQGIWVISCLPCKSWYVGLKTEKKNNIASRSFLLMLCNRFLIRFWMMCLVISPSLEGSIISTHLVCIRYVCWRIQPDCSVPRGLPGFCLDLFRCVFRTSKGQTRS